MIPARFRRVGGHSRLGFSCRIHRARCHAASAGCGHGGCPVLRGRQCPRPSPAATKVSLTQARSNSRLSLGERISGSATSTSLASWASLRVSMVSMVFHSRARSRTHAGHVGRRQYLTVEDFPLSRVVVDPASELRAQSFAGAISRQADRVRTASIGHALCNRNGRSLQVFFCVLFRIFISVSFCYCFWGPGGFPLAHHSRKGMYKCACQTKKYIPPPIKLLPPAIKHSSKNPIIRLINSNWTCQIKNS